MRLFMALAAFLGIGSGSPRVQAAAAKHEEAVIVHFDYGQKDWSRFFEFEQSLEEAIAQAAAAPGLCQCEFEAVRHVKSRSMLLLGDRIDDGLTTRIDDPGDDEARFACVHVNIEVNLAERWDLFQHRTKDLKERPVGQSSRLLTFEFKEAVVVRHSPPAPGFKISLARYALH